MKFLLLIIFYITTIFANTEYVIEKRTVNYIDHKGSKQSYITDFFVIKEDDKEVYSSRALFGSKIYLDEFNSNKFYIKLSDLERSRRYIHILVEFQWENSQISIQHAWGYLYIADYNQLCPYEILFSKQEQPKDFIDSGFVSSLTAANITSCGNGFIDTYYSNSKPNKGEPISVSGVVLGYHLKLKELGAREFNYTMDYIPKDKDKPWLGMPIFTPENIPKGRLYTTEVEKQSDLHKVNNIAYYLDESGFHDEAINILLRVKDKDPKRAVAYLNSADAYFHKYQKSSKKDKESLKHAQSEYGIYTKLMRDQKKSSKISHRDYN